MDIQNSIMEIDISIMNILISIMNSHNPVMDIYIFIIHISMMTSLNGNIFRITGPLCGQFTGHRSIPHTKASEAELWYFIWSAPQ